MALPSLLSAGRRSLAIRVANALESSGAAGVSVPIMKETIDIRNLAEKGTSPQLKEVPLLKLPLFDRLISGTYSQSDAFNAYYLQVLNKFLVLVSQMVPNEFVPKTAEEFMGSVFIPFLEHRFGPLVTQDRQNLILKISDFFHTAFPTIDANNCTILAFNSPNSGSIGIDIGYDGNQVSLSLSVTFNTSMPLLSSMELFYQFNKYFQIDSARHNQILTSQLLSAQMAGFCSLLRNHSKSAYEKFSLTLSRFGLLYALQLKEVWEFVREQKLDNSMGKYINDHMAEADYLAAMIAGDSFSESIAMWPTLPLIGNPLDESLAPVRRVQLALFELMRLVHACSDSDPFATVGVPLSLALAEAGKNPSLSGISEIPPAQELWVPVHEEIRSIVERSLAESNLELKKI